MNTEHIVNATFNTFLFAEPDASELTDYQNELSKDLITPTILALEGAELPDFQQLYLPFANLYKAAFGKHMTEQEIQVWGEVLRKGLTLEQAAQQFIASDSFQAHRTSAGDTPTLLKELVSNSSGVTLSDEEAQRYGDQIDQGEMTAVEALFAIAELIDSLDTGLALLHTSLTGDSGSYVSSGITDAREAINQVYNAYLSSGDSDPVSGVYEENGILYIGSDSSTDFIINLQDDHISDGSGVSIALDLGQMSNVVNLDGRDSGHSLHVTGSSAREVIYSSQHGDTLRPGAGHDTLILQEEESSDTIIFEADAAATGNNRITHFSIGGSSDVIDFSRFLNNVYDTAPLVQALDITQNTTTGLLDWANTDILVLLVEGDASGLNASTLAGYFDGSGITDAVPYLEQPSSSGKNVMITAGVKGDAQIWYLTNADTPLVIEANEIVAVGSLVNVNNLSLTSFTSDSFL